MSKRGSLSTLWRQRLEDWRASGLSQAAWCRQNDVPTKQFWYWKKKLSPTPVQQTVVKAKAKPSAFVPVTMVSEPLPANDLSLSLPGGLTITGITHGNLDMAVTLAGRLK